MKNNRFFAFGCSYTNYFYPTWADLIGSNYKQYYNYGQPGCSNWYIFNAIIEANIIHKFTKEDTIFIAWTGIDRADGYINNAWKLQLHRDENYYINYLDQFKGKLLELMNYVTVLKDLFNAKEISYKFLILTNIDHDYHAFTKDNCHDVVDFYKDSISLIYPGFHQVLTNNRDRPIVIAGRSIDDGHHLPWEHYDYVAKFFPEYVSKTSELRETLITVYERTVDTDLSTDDQNLAWQNANWPIKINGVALEHNKFTLIYPPRQITYDN